MSRKDPPKDKRPTQKSSGRDVSEEEATLWKAMTSDIKPLENRSRHEHPPVAPKETPERRNAAHEVTSPCADRLKQFSIETKLTETKSHPPARHDDHRKERSPIMDGRAFERLRKGKIPIDATLDLHGMNQPQAHAALNAFIQRSASQNLRCLLIITGKGSEDGRRTPFTHQFKGVLRERLPEWLRQSPISSFVLEFHIARQKHGGEGAFYVYLKRNKNKS
jgi:DNA-nicking Smr family endonuclease